MRLFVPPPVQAFAPPSVAEETDQLDAVRSAAFQDGFLAGERAGHTAGVAEGERLAQERFETEASGFRETIETLSSCNTVAGALAQLLEARNADRRMLELETRAAIVAALDTLFPALVNHAAGPELAALISDALTTRAGEQISVLAAPETIEAIKAQGLPESETARLLLAEDPHMTAGEARIGWSGGGLAFDPTALLQQVTEIFSTDSKQEDISQ
jgi:flagellar biosynthesis/type III secretory pathway protein FliH